MLTFLIMVKIRLSKVFFKKELHDDLKAAGATITQKRVSDDLCNNHLHSHTSRKTPLLKKSTVMHV